MNFTKPRAGFKTVEYLGARNRKGWKSSFRNFTKATQSRFRDSERDLMRQKTQQHHDIDIAHINEGYIISCSCLSFKEEVALLVDGYKQWLKHLDKKMP